MMAKPHPTTWVSAAWRIRLLWLHVCFFGMLGWTTMPASVFAQTTCTNGETRPCSTSGSCTLTQGQYVCVGLCHPGIQTCTNGTWGACNGEIKVTGEKCDGFDNNCNGQIDEGCNCTENDTQPCYSGSAISLAHGVCKIGTQTCIREQNKNAWGACVGEVLAKAEICDGLDNNCDGLIDETFPLKGQPCSAGQGECKRLGVYVCQQNGSGVTCNATAGPSSPEICDGKDNNCDGQIDEGCGCLDGTTESCYSGLTGCTKTGSTHTCVAPCKAGTRTCSGGKWGACQGEVVAELEKCDGLDNNCDGQIDEAFPAKGASCSVGLGACKQSGTYVCKSDGSGLVCNAQAGTPATEICDGLDNNCNGLVDEDCTCTPGQTQSCYSGNTGCTRSGTTLTCTAPCKAGQQICTQVSNKAEWGPCIGEIIATPEICDGKDNDCDGQIDEGFDKGKTCTVGVGECSNTGTTACRSDGLGVVCNVSPKAPGIEICDGKDNDCDGQIDEIFPNKGQTCSAGQGECQRQGTLVCKSDGSGLECNATPGPTAQEICDGKDNDCNGQIDENFPTKGNTCTVGVGNCQRTGTFVCNSSGSGVTCNATPGPTAPEICDGQDNDCNGQIDEGCTCTNGTTETCYSGNTGCVRNGTQFVCQTPCQAGTRTCTNGQWGTCVGETLPTSEVCDGKDNNCNGQIDETFPSKGQTCVVGQGECQKTGIFACKSDGSGVECNAQPGSPGQEICDGKDNNCNGQIDEGCQCVIGSKRPCFPGALGCTITSGQPTCTGICQAGIQTCENGGQWGACIGAIEPKAEICDGLDNNCNGQIDEGFSNKGAACTAGIGACEKTGTWVCSTDGSRLECNAVPGTPSPEVCDGKDNDCNGQIDDNNICGGPEQTQEISTSTEDPSSESTSSPEESGTSAPDESISTPEDGGSSAETTSPEDAGPSDTTHTETTTSESTGADITPDLPTCPQQPCAPGEVCRAGRCVSQSCQVDNACLGDEICVAGKCADPTCYKTPCPAQNDVCVAGLCVLNPCLNKTCPTGEICRMVDGLCVPVCPVCTTGQICENGLCVTDPCFGVSCSAGEICIGGTCTQNVCLGSGNPACKSGRVCAKNTCIGDPCQAMSCPAHTTCLLGSCVPKPTSEGEPIEPIADQETTEAGTDNSSTDAEGTTDLDQNDHSPDASMVEEPNSQDHPDQTAEITTDLSPESTTEPSPDQISTEITTDSNVTESTEEPIVKEQGGTVVSDSPDVFGVLGGGCQCATTSPHRSFLLLWMLLGLTIFLSRRRNQTT